MEINRYFIEYQNIRGFKVVVKLLAYTAFDALIQFRIYQERAISTDFVFIDRMGPMSEKFWNETKDWEII